MTLKKHMISVWWYFAVVSTKRKSSYFMIDKQTLRRINLILQDISRSAFSPTAMCIKPIAVQKPHNIQKPRDYRFKIPWFRHFKW